MTGSTLALWAAEAEAAAGIARQLAGTAFIPDSLRVRDQQDRVDWDATVAQVTAALLTGQELGLNPMASLRSIDVIPPGSGSPALRALVMRALLQQHGHDIWVEESTATRAIVRGVRAGTDKVQESVWTIDRARQLAPRGFHDPKGSWQRQPGNQLVARATAECARWIGADVLLGLPYITEEIEDGAADDARAALNGADGQGPPSLTRPRRRTARRPSPARGALPPAAPEGHPPAPEASAAAGNGEPAAPADTGLPRINAAQRAALWAGLKRLGLTERAEALAEVSAWVGRPIPSSNALTEEEAQTALDAIAAEEMRREARAAAEEARAAEEQGGPDAGAADAD